MSIYSDKLTHLQVIINCFYSIAQFFKGKDMLTHISGTPSIDDVMSYNLLKTLVKNSTPNLLSKKFAYSGDLNPTLKFVRYSEHHLNTGPVFKWWSEYRTTI